MKKFLIKTFKQILGKSDKIVEGYHKKDYLQAYSEHTDARIDEDPKAAIGGNWEEIGTLQFEFLKKLGLLPNHTFLDIGCGTLRGGRHFIPYLKEGNYTGIDISPKAIEYAQKLVEEEKLNNKRPNLIVSARKDLKFEEFSGQSFDFILAQSVFTHLMPEHIEECFANIAKIMKSGSSFCFTYFRSKDYKQINYKDFSYPITYFQELANRYDFDLIDYTDEYNHPKNQNMLMIRKRK
jgi:SAM-dependent methyltransferase